MRISGGEYQTRMENRACVSEAEEADGVVLACKLFPDSDLSLKVVGKMAKAVCADGHN